MINLSKVVRSGFKNVSLKDPDSFLVSPGGSFGNKSGIAISEKKAQRITTAYRAVSALSNDFATLPIHLFRKDGNRVENANQQKEARLLRERPNHYQNKGEFFDQIIWRCNFWGNYFAEIKRDRLFQPVELRPIDPTAIRIVKTNNDVLYYDTDAGYAIPSMNMFHIKGKSNDGIVGLPPVKLHAQALGINLALETFQASFYGNGTIPGGILELPDGYYLGDEDEEAKDAISELRQSFEGTYSGVDNYFKILIVEQGMKFNQFQLPFKDMEFFAKGKADGAKDVAKIFNVPLYKLFEAEPKYDNIEALGIEYVQTGLMPWGVRIEEEANAKLLSERKKTSGHYFKINFAGLMRADIKTRYEAYSIAVGKNAPGWASPEEIRLLEEMNPEPEVGELWSPVNMAPQENVKEMNDETRTERNISTNGTAQN